MEGGSVPKTTEEYEMALQRPNRWICKHMLQLVATAENVDIMVLGWRTDKTEWVPTRVFKATGRKGTRLVVPLMLYKDHYTTVEYKAGMEWPEEWVNFSDTDKTCRGAGGRMKRIRRMT